MRVRNLIFSHSKAATSTYYSFKIILLHLLIIYKQKIGCKIVSFIHRIMLHKWFSSTDRIVSVWSTFERQIVA